MDKIKSFLNKNKVHLIAIGIFLIVNMIFFKTQMSGYRLIQHDIEMSVGAAHESNYYYETTGEKTGWTNSLFGGMPTTQVSSNESPNIFYTIYSNFFKLIPMPIGMFFLIMIGAYIGLNLMKVNKWAAIFGALIISLMSYNMMVMSAGHVSKVAAFAFMMPLLGAFWYTYRTNWKLGAIYSLIFMSFEIMTNHVQMTYYFAFLLIALGIAELIRAIISKTYANFVKSTLALLVVYGFSVMINASMLLSMSDTMKSTTRGGNEINKSPSGELLKTSSGLGNEYILQYSNQPEETYTLVSPYVKGVGDFSISAGDSPFSDKASEYSQAVSDSGIYWGENPVVYLGILLVLLAYLAFIYVKDVSKWFFLAVAVLSVVLSWGKFYPGLSEWFIDNIPLYNKFRATTVIVMVSQIIMVVLACLCVNVLIQQQDEIKRNLKKFFISIGAFTVIVIFLLSSRNYALYSEREKQMFEKDDVEQTQEIVKQIMQLTPEQAAANNIDLNNQQQVLSIAQSQAQEYRNSYNEILSFRKDVISSSNTRSISILIFGVVIFTLFAMKYIPNWASLGLIGVIIFVDVVSVSSNYLNDSEALPVNAQDASKSRELDREYRFYKPYTHVKYPMKPNAGDLQILEMETSSDSKLKAIVEKAKQKGIQEENELSESSFQSDHIPYSYQFAALNLSTNYRVLDLTNSTFSSTTASYFHKSIGGYHGAKLQNIQNLIDFHLNRTNNCVLDMMNIKYIIQQGDSGIQANVNSTACGNAWFVKSVSVVNNPYDEIVGLGSKIKLTNAGNGTLLINGQVKKEANVFGAENLQYVENGKSDTLNVPLAGSIPVGVDVTFVMDKNGATNLMMKQGVELDTTKSFKSLVDIRVVSEFLPKEKAIMQASFFKSLKKKTFSGNGKIKMTSYAPNKITYTSDSDEGGLAIFSEVYYPEGWKATVNGKEVPILKADYLLRALDLPKGKNKIVFEFIEKENSSFLKTVSWISSVLGLLVFIFGLFYFGRKSKELQVSEN
jgi:hypothetical protein